MTTKSPIPLNIPKNKKEQFNNVAFVNNMSEYSLKVFIKRLWEQLMSLANVFDDRRSDVPAILDKIMSGQRWNKNDVYDRFIYGLHPDVTIQYDTLERQFKLLDVRTKKTVATIEGITVSEAIQHGKTSRMDN